METYFPGADAFPQKVKKNDREKSCVFCTPYSTEDVNTKVYTTEMWPKNDKRTKKEPCLLFLE